MTLSGKLENASALDIEQAGVRLSTKVVFAKYPIRCGKIIIPKGTPGEALDYVTPRMLETFPNLTQGPNGSLLLVKFVYPGTEEILVARSEVTF